MYQLLGHFGLQKSIVAADDYKSGECSKYDYLFFIGFNPDCIPPDKFLDDAYNYKGTLICLGKTKNKVGERQQLCRRKIYQRDTAVPE